MHKRVGPTHHLDWAVAFAGEAADDLGAVAPQIDDRPTAGLSGIPKPGAMRARVGLARAHPQHITQRAELDRDDRLDRFGRVYQIFEIARKDAGALDNIEHQL